MRLICCLILLFFSTTAYANFDVTLYAKVLTTFVNDEGLVDYATLKKERAQLDDFVTQLTSLEVSVYETWSKEDKVAFWINAYNALMLQSIVNHYPIRKRFSLGLFFPIGVRHIGGVFSRSQHKILGESMSLDRIEHVVLRKQFQDPRVHLALVCAAKGCPRLLREPYLGAKLGQQFTEQAHHFFNNPLKFYQDKDRKIIWVSSIFSWFEDDFAKETKEASAFAGKNKKQRAVVQFISTYLPKADWQLLQDPKAQVRYLPYDWALNDQSTAIGETR